MLSNMVNYSLQKLFTIILYLTPSTAHRRRCAYGDSCWPDDATWSAFNASVAGRLIRSVPSAAVCHQERFDSGLCDTAKQEWKNSFWRTNQTGAYSAVLWELGNNQCYINSPKTAPCSQGLGEYSFTMTALYLPLVVPYYSVAVTSVDDIQKSVKFANKKNLYLVVKNTGHSQ